MYRLSTITLGLTIYALNATAQSGGNILVIVADDLGKEVLSLYDTPTTQRAVTPNLDRLAQRGITFDNLWGAPLSSPARAAMLTGRYGHHTGVVELDVDLPTSETTLFEALPQEYATSAIGKWHLSRDDDFAPKYGIDHFDGFAYGGGVRSYSYWRRNRDGEVSFCNKYITTQITDSAIDWISKQDSPWLCWVAYNAPHTPLHLPPSHMHTHSELSDEAAAIEQNPLPYYLAMVESLDYEIGRLLEGVDDSTTVIFIGDNGTDNDLLQSPYPSRHGKGTLYESGVSIPMIAAGGAVSQEGTRCSAAINAVDLFPTILELAGAERTTDDSISAAALLSGGNNGDRRYLFSEIMNKRLGHMCAISDREYKLITTKGEPTMFFDLTHDPLEERNLLGGSLSKQEREAFGRLTKELSKMNIPTLAQSQSQSDKPQQRNRDNNRSTTNRKRL